MNRVWLVFCGNFEIVIFCVFWIEVEVVWEFFDYDWEDDGWFYDKVLGDFNVYFIGFVGCYNVVFVYLFKMGKVIVVVVVLICWRSFFNVKLVFIVGVCGVVFIMFDGKIEIVFGDIVLSMGVI